MNHGILLLKLDRYGIRGVAYELIANCLYNRYLYVKNDDKFSTASEITTGVTVCLNVQYLVLYYFSYM